MLIEFVTSEAGAYLLSFALAVGVGLAVNWESRASWIGGLLITAVFVLIAFAYFPEAPLAVPLYVIVVGVASVLANVRRYSASPLLAEEPYWRKVALTLTHQRGIRDADIAHREAQLAESTAGANK